MYATFKINYLTCWCAYTTSLAHSRRVSFDRGSH
jgi:hypothetical protein